MNKLTFYGLKLQWNMNANGKLLVAVHDPIKNQWTAREVTVAKRDRNRDLIPHVLCAAKYGNRIPKTIAISIWPNIAASCNKYV